jgi:hypothetical protein
VDEAGGVMTEDRSDELRDWYAEDEINGAQLLDEVHATLTRYVAFANNHQPVAVALWIIATHALVAWQHATRLIITSPRKRCGKSRLLDVVAGLAYSALLCVNATTAAIFRSIGNDESQIPTLMFDEADALWVPSGPPRTTKTCGRCSTRVFSATGPPGGVLGRCRFRLPSTPSLWRRSPVSVGHRTP